MKIGVVAEIKDQENRVALTPPGAADLVQTGRQVLVQGAAGLGAGFDDDVYEHAGADDRDRSRDRDDAVRCGHRRRQHRPGRLCVETARPTTHARPVYREHDVIHYGVANMPGAHPRTATIALTDATLPYVMKLADRGLEALRQDTAFAKGVNVHGGHVCCRLVSEDLDLLDSYRAIADIDV